MASAVELPEQRSDRLIVVSADGHAGPPVAAFGAFVDPKYRDLFEDYSRMVESFDAAFAEIYQELVGSDLDARTALRVERETTAGLYQPEDRLRDLDSDGVAAEVIFPQGSVPFHKYPPQFSTPHDVEFPASNEVLVAGCRAYNRWLADLCAAAPGRHLGVAVVPIRDVSAAVAEVEWAHEAGLRGVSLPSVSMGEHPDFPYYNDPVYEPFWAACAERGMPLHCHGTSPGHYGNGPDAIALIFAECDFYARRPLWFLIFSGVFDRHPSLQLVFTEQRAGWVTSTLEFLDSIYPMPGGGLVDVASALKLSRRPSEFFASNCWIGASFMSRSEVAARPGIGVDRIMWGRDYPHPEGTWPLTAQSLRMTFGDVPEAELRPMLGENAIRCYGLERAPLESIAARIGPRAADVLQPLDEIPSGGDLTWAFRSTSGFS